MLLVARLRHAGLTLCSVQLLRFFRKKHLKLLATLSASFYRFEQIFLASVDMMQVCFGQVKSSAVMACSGIRPS